MNRLVAVAITTTAVTAGGLVGPAHAAPVNSPKAQSIAVDCGALGPFTIVPAPGNGEWTPGHLVGTRRVLVPHRFTFSFTVGTTTVTETVTKKGPLPAGSVTCSFGETFTEDGVTYTFTGTATGPLRGKR